MKLRKLFNLGNLELYSIINTIALEQHNDDRPYY